MLVTPYPEWRRKGSMLRFHGAVRIKSGKPALSIASVVQFSQMIKTVNLLQVTTYSVYDFRIKIFGTNGALDSFYDSTT